MLKQKYILINQFSSQSNLSQAALFRISCLLLHCVWGVKAALPTAASLSQQRDQNYNNGYGEEKTPIRSHYNFRPRLNWIVIPWTIFCCGPEPYLLHLLTSQVQLFTNWTQNFNFAWKHTIEVELNEHFCISVVSIFPKILLTKDPSSLGFFEELRRLNISRILLTWTFFIQ